MPIGRDIRLWLAEQVALKMAMLHTDGPEMTCGTYVVRGADGARHPANMAGFKPQSMVTAADMEHARGATV